MRVAYRVAERFDEIDVLLQVFIVGRFMHPPEGRNASGCEIVPHRLVGGEHELLDQDMRVIVFLASHAGDSSVFVVFAQLLWHVEVERDARKTVLP